MTALTPRMIVFIVLCFLQICVPGLMIGRREATLRMGTAYRFKTAPVDPHDPFRGRYVALRFEENSAKAEEAAVKRGRKVFVSIFEGEDGFAKLGEVSLKPPEEGDYVKALAGYSSGEGMVRVELPFDRYYMNERKAPAAERAYFSSNRRGEDGNTYALVKVLDGMAVTEGLYIDGVPVLEYLQEGPHP